MHLLIVDQIIDDETAQAFATIFCWLWSCEYWQLWGKFDGDSKASEEGSSDEEISGLRQVMNSTGKSNEIVQIREAHELADIAIALGKGTTSCHD